MSVEIAKKEKTNSEYKKPRMYKVIFVNDDYTNFEFVMGLLMEIFHKNREEAEFLTQQIHRQGTGVAGVYTKDIAETKVYQCMIAAQSEEHPLQVYAEPQENN